MADQPLFSIVVTAYTMERLQNIYELIDSIKAQTYHNVEVVFVTEHSRELVEMVKAYALEKAITNIKAIFNDGEAGASAARNLGIKQSHGDIIAFVDDDVVVFPNWVEQMVEAFKDYSVIAITGPAIPLWPDKPVLWFPEEFYWVFGCTKWTGLERTTEVRNVWTMNAAFKREAFIIGGLFSTSIGPKGGSMSGRKRELSEDLELSLRVKESTGKRILYYPGAKVQHRVDMRRLQLSFISRWAYWAGYSKQKLKKLYGSTNINVLDQEYNLLKRIGTKLLPSLMTKLPRHPLRTSRSFLITLTVLGCVATGYFTALFVNDKKKTYVFSYLDGGVS